MNTKPPLRYSRDRPEDSGQWRAVPEALDSNVKTARLIAILLAPMVICTIIWVIFAER